MGYPRLLFILKQKQGEGLWVDKSSRKPGLHNSINSLVYGLRSAGIDATLVDVADRNGIDAVVREHKPDVVVIEAYWVTPGKFQLLKLIHPNVHWIVRNHSEIPFLAEEASAGMWNCEYLKMGVEVSSVSTRTVNDLMNLQMNLNVDSSLVSYLPNVYWGDGGIPNPVKEMPTDEIHIGCFGALRPMKNHFQQAMAAIGYAASTGRKLFFHINGTRVESHGASPLKNLRGTFARLYNAELVEHPWMEKDQFYKLLQERIDVLLQCSLTESFNIVAADAVLCGVPVISSGEVRWLSDVFHCDPTDSTSIVNHLSLLFSADRKHLENYCDVQYSNLMNYNERAIQVWLERF